jgi:hypothetical protein
MDMAAIGELFANPTPSDGNCLFHAVNQCLTHYSGSHAGYLAEKLRMLGLPRDKALTATHLRFLAYAVFLVPGPDTDLWLSKWIMMHAIAPAEYSHIACVAGKKIEDITTHDRILLHAACMASTTWGDETALLVLELMLNLRIMVLSGGVLQPRSNVYGSFYPDLFIVLQLTNMHYESVFYKAHPEAAPQWAFAEAELPDLLVWLSHRDCKKTREPFINLRHLCRGESEDVGDGGVDDGDDDKLLAPEIRLQYFRVLKGEWK